MLGAVQVRPVGHGADLVAIPEVPGAVASLLMSPPYQWAAVGALCSGPQLNAFPEAVTPGDGGGSRVGWTAWLEESIRILI